MTLSGNSFWVVLGLGRLWQATYRTARSNPTE